MTQHTLSYRPEIDGLRCVAVLPVLLFHAGLGFTGGYVGVDVFFVISGFLIGSLVIKEIEADSFTLTDFWERRVRRLFPALVVVILATILVASFLMVAEHYRKFGQSVIAQPLIVSNFFFWRQHAGYFEPAAEYHPLLHTWSLAVEEQFYLLFPLLMVFLRTKGKRLSLGIVSAVLTLSLGWSIYSTAQYPSLSFFLIPSRAWELLIGVLLAMLQNSLRPSRSLGEVLSWLGIGLILVSVFTFDLNTPFPGWKAMIPCLGAALIILSNSGIQTSLGRILSTGPIVFVGKISYSLYLWHWPIIVFLKYYLVVEPTPLQYTGALLASFILAFLTWKFVENPFRQKAILGTRKQLFVVSTIISALLVAAGTIIYKMDGIPQRLPENLVHFKPVQDEFNQLSGLPQLYKEGTLPTIGATSGDGSKGKILVWGDSHSMSMLPVLDDLGKEFGITIYAATQPGTAPVPYTWGDRWDKESENHQGKPVLDFITQEEISHVILIARWPIYVFGTEGGELKFLISDSETTSHSPEDAKKVFTRNMTKAFSDWKAQGVHVWVMEDVAVQPRPVPSALTLTAMRGLDLNSIARPSEEVDAQNERFRNLLLPISQEHQVELLDPLPYFLGPDGTYLIAKDNLPLYNDDHHLSPYGSRLLRPMLRPLFEAASNEGD